VFDLSHTLDAQTQVYPGDPVFACHRVATVKEDGYNVTSFSLGSHTGTHIDAPFHFLDDGPTVEELDLRMLMGPAAVADMPRKGAKETFTWDDLISDHEFLRLIRGGKCRIVVIHTGWSRHWKTPTYLDHPFLDKDVARKLIEHGVQVLAVDTLSPDRTVTDGPGADFGVHETILGAGCVIVENLTGLENLPSGKVDVSFLPLKLSGCDGSPIRAVAWTSD